MRALHLSPQDDIDGEETGWPGARERSRDHVGDQGPVEQRDQPAEEIAAVAHGATSALPGHTARVSSSPYSRRKRALRTWASA